MSLVYVKIFTVWQVCLLAQHDILQFYFSLRYDKTNRVMYSVNIKIHVFRHNILIE